MIDDQEYTPGVEAGTFVCRDQVSQGQDLEKAAETNVEPNYFENIKQSVPQQQILDIRPKELESLKKTAKPAATGSTEPDVKKPDNKIIMLKKSINVENTPR